MSKLDFVIFSFSFLFFSLFFFFSPIFFFFPPPLLISIQPSPLQVPSAGPLRRAVLLHVAGHLGLRLGRELPLSMTASRPLPQRGPSTAISLRRGPPRGGAGCRRDRLRWMPRRCHPPPRATDLRVRYASLPLSASLAMTRVSMNGRSRLEPRFQASPPSGSRKVLLQLIAWSCWILDSLAGL